jgi:hypothetical protein
MVRFLASGFVPVVAGALLLLQSTAGAAPYTVLLESNEDRSDGTEVFLTSFDTFDDLINSPPSGGVGAFSGLNVNPAYSVGGFVSAFPGDDPGATVAEPGTLLLLAAGLGLLGLRRRAFAAGHASAERPLAQPVTQVANGAMSRIRRSSTGTRSAP